MSSIIIVPVAEALVTRIEAIGLTGHLWEPKELKPPAGTVGVPSLRRSGVDEAESQLGSDDWFLDFPVSFYFHLRDAAKAQLGMVEALEAFVNAIDADPSLGINSLLDAKVTAAIQFVEQDRKAPLAGYEITVATQRLVQQ